MAGLAFSCITVSQPIGTFYLISVPATLLVNSVRISPRQYSSPDNESVQRDSSDKRIKEIALYVTDPDATFPTAIIISADSRKVEVNDQTPVKTLVFARDEKEPNSFELGELLDGQHRVKGLKRAMENGVDLEGFELPVVVMLDLDIAEKAYVFSIINSKQTPVNKSLIYDLFGLSTERSPYLTSHEVARAMNTQQGGPFERGLKMLGKRNSPTEMLTQGSFVKYLLEMITKSPDRDAIALKTESVLVESDRPFNAFFRNERDELILKTMTNYFSAIREVFPHDWNPEAYVKDKAHPDQPTPVLRRTVGHEALMRALMMIWPEARARKTVELDFFLEKARTFRQNIGNTPIDTSNFRSSGADAGRLANLLVNGEQAAKG